VLFIDVGDAIFPDLGFPGGCGKGVSQYAAEAVERAKLAGFLIDVHLGQQVVDAFFEGLGGIFVDIHHSIFIEIDPFLVVKVCTDRG
jgi:hypothetical protein